MNAIRDELDALEVENCEGRPIVPYHALKDLFDRSTVTALIRDLTDQGKIQIYEQQGVVESIINNGLRLFAVLLSLSRPELILKFMKTDHFAESQLDSRMPLSLQALAATEEDDKLRLRIYKLQWKFWVPFLRADQLHRDLDHETRLPFVDCTELRGGGFGEIHRLALPAHYQSLVPKVEGKVYVIRKRIKQKAETEPGFRREQHILSMLRCLRHPNIIELLTSYTIDQTHNFLFPLAEGDLKDFFRQKDRPVGFETDGQNFQALYELASAIEAVHDYFSESFNVRKIGCHYDLKPDNVLYRSGRLILSDFGLSRLTEKEEGSKSLYRNGGGEYMAPECVSIQDDFLNLPVGRSSDMWSFGCLLSEMLTYLANGPPGIDEFSKSREIVFAGFWTCKAFHAGDEPHEGVMDWLSKLSRGLTTKCQKKLLTLVRDLLQMNASDRPSAKEVTLGLFHIGYDDFYASIDQIFHSLATIAGPELHIEYQRFRLWGEYTGFRDGLVNSWRPRHPSELETFGSLKTMGESFRVLRLELENLSVMLNSSSATTSKLHVHLQRIIDSQWDMLLSSTRNKMVGELENRLLGTDDRVQLEFLKLAFHTPEDQVEAGVSSRAAYRRIGLLAVMKQIASAFDEGSLLLDDMHIQEEQIQGPLRKFHWHSIGIYTRPDGKSTRVLIEHLEYDDSWMQRVDELIQRVRGIASIRAISTTALAFPVLTCAGYFHNLANHVFGTVYDFPTRQNSTLSDGSAMEFPVSLRDIFLTLNLRKTRPSLDQVFTLASKLLSAVMIMHRASWLHKSISSYNVIFFPDRFNSTADSLISPYLIGFNYSRLNLETAFTQGSSQQLEYQHPEYLQSQKRFRQEYDYYSVGLVLLELGFWAPLHEITKHIRGTPEELRMILLHKYVPTLRSFMGISYTDAVEACLSGSFGDNPDPVAVREAFEERVLQRVERRLD